MPIQVVILAAGQGKRMRSALPKVLHPLGGKSLLEHVIDTANTVAPDLSPIIVYGHQGEFVRAALTAREVKWVEQKAQLGTGHALQQALPEIATNTQVLVLYGDVPLISTESLQRLIQNTPKNALGMLTAHSANPTGYGRIKRDQQQRVIGVVEEKDATEQEKLIDEINPGIYLIPANYLQKWLPELKNTNAQAEYYLTDMIAFGVREQVVVHTEQPVLMEEIQGVNDRVQLAQLERFYQRSYAEKLMRLGVTLADPARFDIRGEVTVGQDVFMDINVILEGRVVIGDNCVIGANVILRDTELAPGVVVRPNSMIDGATIAAECIIGPYARIRPGTHLAARAHVGNFVEIKKSVVGTGSKVNHLSYIGDSDIGNNVNIGAGTITCNYDGVNKHKTVIGDNAFIGSNTELVAPVTVGEGATIGAGSTITKDAPPHQLTVSRVPQSTRPEWQRPQQKNSSKNGERTSKSE